MVITTVSFSAFSQQSLRDTTRNNYRQEFLLNPFAFFVGGFEVGYGSINKKQHLRRVFGGYYFAEDPGFYNDQDNTPTINNPEVTYKNMEGFRLEGQYLFLKPTDGGLRFYGGPFAVFKTINMDISRRVTTAQTTIISNYNARASSGILGVIAGARSYVMDNVFVDLYIGGGITVPFSSSNIDDVHLEVLNPYKRSINPRGNITIGLAF